MRLGLPEDPSRRALLIGVVCSILLHVLLLGSMIWVNTFGPATYVKRGEPLFVDIAPDKPEEKAPLGSPARPVGPPEREPEAPKAPAPPPPTPKIAEAPPPPKPQPRAPEPPREVAKAQPPAPAAKPPEPQPVPQPQAPAPEPVAKAPEPKPAAPQPTETAKSEPQPPAKPAAPSEGTQTALAKPSAAPPPSIFRHPGEGGGLRGGRGGVEGEPIPLDTPEPKYQDYFNKVRDRIKAKWIYPREAGERGIQGELLLEFHIAKDGRLELLELRHSSGVEILDRFAMNAVRLAQPFPPVPDDIAKQVLAINGVFRYQIVSGFVNQFLR